MRLQLRTVAASMPAVAVLTLIVVKNVGLFQPHSSFGPALFMELVGVELLLLPMALYAAVRLGRVPYRTAAKVFVIAVDLQIAVFCLAPLFG